MFADKRLASVGNASSSDFDLTPQPLRVIKDISVMSTTGNESFVTAYENQRSTIPKRKSSLSRQSSISIQSRAPQALPSPPSHGRSLLIPRQRAETADPHASDDPRSLERGHFHKLLVEILGRKQEDKESSILQAGFRKAVRNGVLPQRLSRKLIKPTSNMAHSETYVNRRIQSENVRPDISHVAAKSSRRAVTDGHLISGTYQKAGQLSRRLSLRERPLRGLADLRMPARTASQDVDYEIRPISADAKPPYGNPSIRAVTPSATSLDRTLKVFPCPPMQNNLRLRHSQPCETFSQSEDQSSRELSEPGEPRILNGKLSFTPEFESVSFENGESIFALAQFEAVPGLSEPPPSLNNSRSALDIIVVIDNTAFSSPTTLMAHCETARYIASILDPAIDRIGIVCASKVLATSHIVLPLAKPDARHVKKAVDSISTYSDGMETACMSTLLELAQTTLLRPADRIMTTRERFPVYAHVFVLAHQVDVTCKQFQLDPRLTLHMVCGEAIPTLEETLPSTNGWRIRSFSEAYPLPASKNRVDKESHGFTRRIDSLISQARTGQRVGILRDVEWELCSCKDTTIEKVWGLDHIAEMQPGDISTLVVKIRCNVPKLASAFRMGRLPSFIEGDDDMFDEVERLFAGLSGTPLLRAAVSYSHSCLPSDTVCASLGTCHSRSYVSSPGAPAFASKPKPTLYSAQRTAVHRHLALQCLAEHGYAIGVAKLREILGESGKHFTCGKFVAALVKQQQYQAIKDVRITKKRNGYPTSTSSVMLRRKDETRSPAITPSKRNREMSGSGLPDSKRQDDKTCSPRNL